MIKYIISDLDGTLIHQHTTIRKEDIAALQTAVDHGIGIVFASGRMAPEIKKVTDELNIQTHAVSQNGAFVHLADGSLLRESAFERELLVKLIALTQQTSYILVLSAADYYFIEEVNEQNQWMAGRLMAPLICIPDLLQRVGIDLNCGKLSLFGDVNSLRLFKHELDAQFGGQIDTYISDVDCLDIMPNGISKGTGIDKLLSHLELLPEQVVCIGDSFNDLSMFAVTPHSFAMSTSHADVRARAVYTISGVAEVVDWVMEHRESSAG